MAMMKAVDAVKVGLNVGRIVQRSNFEASTLDVS